MKIKDRIIKSYKFFSLAEGNQHIASEYAILKLQELIKKFRIKNVLEVGLGIGSIAGTLLVVNDELCYTGTETSNLCLESLSKNLAKNYERLKIYSDLDSLPGNKKFSLIIVDGKDPDLESIRGMLSKRGIIVIEGDRLQQQKILQNLFPCHKMVHSISLSKNRNYSPFPKEEWQGGIKIIFVSPSAKQYIWWIREKFMTKLKYQYPGRYLGKHRNPGIERNS